MTCLSIRLLGPFLAEIEGKQLRKFRTNKVKALLVYLVTEQAFADWPLEHQRAALMAMLWPNLPQKSAQANLRQVIYHLRQAIQFTLGESNNPEKQLLWVDRQTMCINPQAVYDLDIANFRALVDSCRNHNHTMLNSCAKCQESLMVASSLYRGDFIANFSLSENEPFEEWSFLRREYLRRQVLKVLHNITEAFLFSGSYERAEAAARRQLEIDNLRDSAYRQLIKALACRGQRASALAEYSAYCDLLIEELNARPTDGVKSMVEEIRANKPRFLKR